MSRCLSIRLILSACVLVLVIGCTGAAGAIPPTPESTPTPKPAAFRVVAYVTDAAIPALIPFDILTHINYAFLIPNEDGTFQPLNPWMAGELPRLAH